MLKTVARVPKVGDRIHFIGSNSEHCYEHLVEVSLTSVTWACNGVLFKAPLRVLQYAPAWNMWISAVGVNREAKHASNY